MTFRILTGDDRGNTISKENTEMFSKKNKNNNKHSLQNSVKKCHLWSKIVSFRILDAEQTPRKLDFVQRISFQDHIAFLKIPT